MGVHGLWRLIDPSGKPVPLETLENKILAVDISIWLHQAIKGFQDSRGAPLPNAHLLGIYHRVCKLLYFRIRPVFVFDGGVPALKKQTIISRNQHKNRMVSDASSIQNKLLNTLLKHSAIQNVLGEKAKSSIKEKTVPAKPERDDIFKLPKRERPENEPDSTLDSTLDSTCSCSTSETDESSTSPTKQWDLHTIDERSAQFKSLPADVRHEILTDLKATRKQSSWGRLHELPTESGDFSSFQMKRLLKRYSVQVSLEEAEREMGGHSLSLGELQSLLTDEGIVTASRHAKGRVASNENLRYLYIKDLKKEIEKARAQDEERKAALARIEEDSSAEEPEAAVTDREYQRDLAAAIQLSLQDNPSTSGRQADSTDPADSGGRPWVDGFGDGDFASSSDSEAEAPQSMFAQAKGYMTEYSGLPPALILEVMGSTGTSRPRSANRSTRGAPAVPQTEKMQGSEVEESRESDAAAEVSEEVRSGEPRPADLAVSDSSDSGGFVGVQGGAEPRADDKIVDLEDSSSDGDFIEVGVAPDMPKVEIVIDPTSAMEDDIFSDIFTETPKDAPRTAEEAGGSTAEAAPVVVESVAETKETVPPTEERMTAEKDDEKTAAVKQGKEGDAVRASQVKESSALLGEIVQLVSSSADKITAEQLGEVASRLEEEQQELVIERNTKTRMAGNITDQMYLEAQELLELFGLPYIVAPMEAEAQCAFLEEINLTDGTITDDSDIWLFGGRTVYKNFFNQSKQVVEFRAESIQHYFKLSREQMILLALLVGSDYTVGLQGIGPVTALEVLASFPPPAGHGPGPVPDAGLLSGLVEFRNWLTEGRGLGRTALRKKLQNVTVTEGFPNEHVVWAYLRPQVDTCSDKFTWGKPDAVSLADFAKEKFGWSRQKSEGILSPVTRRLQETGVQKSIKDYFRTTCTTRAALDDPRVSKRIRMAVEKIGQTPAEVQREEAGEPKQRKQRNRRNVVPAPAPALGRAEPSGAGKDPEPGAGRRAARGLRGQARKERIPQKELGKEHALKARLKAIEVFRKSKQGPGFVKRRPKVDRQLKGEAELSEDSSGD